MTWTTKYGEEIEIKDMETDHIKNCIRLLENGHMMTECIDIGYTCDGDGDGIIYCNVPNEKLTNDYLKAFKKELERREKNNDGWYKRNIF